MTAVCRSSFQDGGQLFQRSRAAKWNRCAKAFIRSNKEAKSASTNKGGLLPKTNHPTVVQISLDFTDIKEAIETAHAARCFPLPSDCRRPQDDGWRLSGSRDDGEGRSDARGCHGTRPCGND